MTIMFRKRTTKFGSCHEHNATLPAAKSSSQINTLCSLDHISSVAAARVSVNLPVEEDLKGFFPTLSREQSRSMPRLLSPFHGHEQCNLDPAVRSNIPLTPVRY